PLFVRLRNRLGGRSWLAATALVVLMVLALALPLALAAQSMVVHSADVVEAVRGFLDRRSSIELPGFIVNLPLVGPALDAYLRTLLESSVELAAFAKRFTDPAKNFLVVMGRAAGDGL